MRVFALALMDKGKGYKVTGKRQVGMQCIYCNKYFTIQRSKYNRGDGKYCGRECKCLHSRTLYKGKKHSEETKQKISISKIGNRNIWWIDGRSFYPYPIAWNESLKRSIRERDNYECNNCGIPQKELKEKLHVHHIDFNKENLDENNLVSLCRSCHITLHNNIRNGIPTAKEKESISVQQGTNQSVSVQKGRR